MRNKREFEKRLKRRNEQKWYLPFILQWRFSFPSVDGPNWFKRNRFNATESEKWIHLFVITDWLTFLSLFLSFFLSFKFFYHCHYYFLSLLSLLLLLLPLLILLNDSFSGARSIVTPCETTPGFFEAKAIEGRGRRHESLGIESNLKCGRVNATLGRVHAK